MTLPEWPIWLVDFFGSGLMIIFSLLCLDRARSLRREDPENVVWAYLLWVCYGLSAFAISRGIGHLAKRLLLAAGQTEVWLMLRPFSGGINTLMFVLVAAITLFFGGLWRVYQLIERDRRALADAHERQLHMNRHLEALVEERTRESLLSESKYRRIFEVSRDMILISDPGGTILELNPAGAEMLKIRDLEEVRGHTAFGTFFKLEQDWEALRQRLLDDCFVSDAEVELVSHDGSPLSMLLSATGKCRETGDQDRFHFLGKDITQRKVMQKQLLQADKLASIGQLAAGVAHEINNPLSIILGYTQLLIRGEDEDTERYTDLRTIEKHTRSCKTIVQDLLSFARSSRTRKTMGSLQSSIEDIVNVVRHQFELDDVELALDFDPRVPPMVLDREKIGQVVMNLIMNARQAIGKRGTIEIRTHFDEASGEVTMTVGDNGCGMEAHVIPRIFDPFYTTKITGEGTGLGLSVSYGIVQDHGGSIAVESEPQKGTLFTVTLPVMNEESE